MARVAIREAVPDDAEAVARLLGELGYPGTVEFARDKLACLAEADADTVLVAQLAGSVVGIAHLHVAELFQAAGRIGRVMAIVVDESARRRGIGRALMGKLEERARRSGCVRIDLTSAERRTDAHAFYRAVGFD